MAEQGIIPEILWNSSLGMVGSWLSRSNKLRRDSPALEYVVFPMKHHVVSLSFFFFIYSLFFVLYLRRRTRMRKES